MLTYDEHDKVIGEVCTQITTESYQYTWSDIQMVNILADVLVRHIVPILH